MPTFDITSTFDKQEVTNAVDQMNRELVNRYDFRDTNTSALLSENVITIKSSTDERLNAADQVLREKFAKRNISIKFLSDFKDEKTPSESKRIYTLKSGVNKDIAKEIVKNRICVLLSTSRWDQQHLCGGSCSGFQSLITV